MDEISLPTHNMQIIAQNISKDTQELIHETSPNPKSRLWNLIENSVAELPSSMLNVFDRFLEPFSQEIQQAITLREDIGSTLKTAADVADNAEWHIVYNFQSK